MRKPISQQTILHVEDLEENRGVVRQIVRRVGANLVEAVDATGVVVPAAGRTVAVVGLTDVVVVDTGDALLVTTLQRAQDVKGIVDTLKATGRTRLT